MLDTSDTISLISVITSLFISTITLVYNAKVVRDSLKPDIQVYLHYLSSDDPQCLIIKNFGKTGSTIRNIKHNFPEEHSAYSYLEPVDEIYLAPNQVILLPFISKELKKIGINEIIFEFESKYGMKKIKSKNYISLHPSPLNENLTCSAEQSLAKISVALNKLLMK
mgnify:CR=1 FL=1